MMSINKKYHGGEAADYPVVLPTEQHISYAEVDGVPFCIVAFTVGGNKGGYAIRPDDARTLMKMIQNILYHIDNGIKAVQ